MDRPRPRPPRTYLITKRCSISLKNVQKMAANSKILKQFDDVRLRPSVNATLANQHVAKSVADLLATCPDYTLRAVESGSWARGVRLKKPAWGDVDVVCFIQADLRDGIPIYSFDHFEAIRFKASKRIKEWLEKELLTNKIFDEQAVVDFYPGFVIKLRIKRFSVAFNPWNIDILFAHELSVNNNAPQWNTVQQQLAAMSPPSKPLSQTNSMAPFRDDFLKSLYDKHPRAKRVVRFLKAWNRVLMKKGNEPAPGEEHCISGFFFEMLALLMIENGLIPTNLDLSRALATCLFAIVNPNRVKPLFFPAEMAGGDASSRPAPPNQRQLDDLRRSSSEEAGEGECLVLVDPMAPFNNVARRKKKTKEAWERLEESAKKFLQFLESKNVRPYEF